MPRPTKTKAHTLRAMLARKQGASLAALTKATGWQTHSVWAALSGLRKGGYEIARETGNEQTAASIYRITKAPEAAE